MEDMNHWMDLYLIEYAYDNKLQKKDIYCLNESHSVFKDVENLINRFSFQAHYANSSMM